MTSNDVASGQEVINAVIGILEEKQFRHFNLNLSKYILTEKIHETIKRQQLAGERIPEFDGEFAKTEEPGGFEIEFYSVELE